jgi:amino acid adenylation domain-containing protein
MLLLAAWAVVLGRHAEQDDVLVGTPVAGRHRREIEDLIGFFVNTLVLRASWTSAGATFQDVLARVRAAALDGFAHQDLPFERLVEELVPARDLSTSPLFQVMFTLQAAAAGGLALPGLALEPLSLDSHLAKFDLTLTVGEGDGVYAASLEHNTDLFDAATAERLLARFAALLAAAVAGPDQAVADLPLLPPAERHQLLVEWNDTAAAVRSGVRLEELFAAQAAAHPDALAVAFEGEELSYGALAARVHRLAHLLIEQGVGRGTPVGVWMERSLHLPVAALGILEAGGVYVPLDAAWPAERVRTVLAATEAPVLLVSRATLSAAETLRWRLPRLGDVICPDLAAPEPEPETVDTASVRALFDYVAERATDRVTAGGFVSSFTGLPFSEAEVDEYRDRVLALAAPWLRPDARTLEIGSGSGLILWEMARRVAHAVGLDPSERTQERNRAAAEAAGLANIELPVGFAHEIETLFPPASFDLVLLASTVQFFPGTRYLEHVLAAALRLLAPGGALLVADVMDARREEEVARALALAGGGHSTAGTELWIDEDLFRDWASGLPDAAAPEVLHRTEGFANELGYRYDVLVRKEPGAPRTARRRKRTWTGWHLDSRPAAAPALAGAPEDVAYVIHTSGSTGAPKAIVVQHGPAVRLVDWVNETFGVRADDRLLFVTSPAFDLSIYDLFGPLAAGAAIHVAPEHALRDPEHLLRLLRDEPVTFWDSAPAALQQLAPLFRPAPDAPLRLVLLSGDWIPVPLPDQVRAAFPRARVVSLGGATEATVWSNWYPVGAVDPAWPSIPYGRPMANARYLVLDEALTPSPIGVSGDLYIGGSCLATGYADPDLTAAAFLPDPFAPASGARLYRTGDRARFGRDGNLELLGRRDQQVKVRGYRIELGDIEAALLRHPAVREAVVLAREDLPGHRLLAAYVVPPPGETPDEGTLRAWLGRALPAYMVPSAFVRLDAFPVTANGKLDRKALPAPERHADESIYVAPGDETEETLATLWQEVLGLDRVGIHDNFFTLGGHSLVATQVISRIREMYGVDLPLRRLFETPTIAQIAQRVREERIRVL